MLHPTLGILSKLWKALKTFERDTDMMIFLESNHEIELLKGSIDPPSTPGKILTRDKAESQRYSI